MEGGDKGKKCRRWEWRCDTWGCKIEGKIRKKIGRVAKSQKGALVGKKRHRIPVGRGVGRSFGGGREVRKRLEGLIPIGSRRG